MDPFTLETTIHRIGGSVGGPREFGPWLHQVHPDGETHQTINARYGPSWMRVRISRWALVRPGLLSASLLLEDMNGQPVGHDRAILVNTLPSDVPLYTNHVGPEEYGVCSVGLRIPRSVWTPAYIETAANLGAHQEREAS